MFWSFLYRASRAAHVAFGCILLVPAAVFAVASLGVPQTIVGGLYVSSLLGLSGGAIGSAWPVRWPRILETCSVAVFALTLGSQLVCSDRPFGATATVMPDDRGPRWVNRLVPEEDAVLLSARAGAYLGLVSSREAEGFVDALTAAYRDMRREHGAVPSPLIATALGMQSADNFDLLVFPPLAEPPHSRAVIFLHGAAGNWSLLCWLVADAVREAGDFITVCPSVQASGDWTTTAGAATLERTIAALHQRGVTEIYLAGLSQGAVGASELSARFAPELAGVLLLFGSGPEGARAALPTLLIYGRHDQRFPPSFIAAAIASQAQRGGALTPIGLQADHFGLVKQRSAVRDAIAAWLRSQRRSRTPAQ